MKLLKKSVIDYCTAVIFALVLAGSVLLNLSPVWFVLLSAVTGAALKALEARYAARRAENVSETKPDSAAQSDAQADTSGADEISESAQADTDGGNDAQPDNHGDGAETERDKT